MRGAGAEDDDFRSMAYQGVEMLNFQLRNGCDRPIGYQAIRQDNQAFFMTNMIDRDIPFSIACEDILMRKISRVQFQRIFRRSL